MYTRTKHALVATAAAGALAVAGLSTAAHADVVVPTATPCNLPGNPAGASATATPFILNYGEYVPNATTGYPGVEGDLNANDAYLLVSPRNFDNDPILAGTTPVAYYKNYQDFYDSVYGANGGTAIPAGYKWVAYDPEQWTGQQLGDTPGVEPNALSSGGQLSGGSGELGDPTAAMAGFIQLAHQFGYKVLVTPSPDLTYYLGSGEGAGSWAVNAALNDTWAQVPNPITPGTGDPAAPWPTTSSETLSQAAAGADIYEVQNQAYEESQFEPGTVGDWPGTSYSWYQEYVQQAALQATAAAAAAHDTLEVFGGLGGDRAPNAAGMETDFRQTDGLAVSGTVASVSGYWLNITPSGAPSTQTWNTVTGFLAAEPAGPACTTAFGQNHQADQAILAGNAAATACPNCSDGERVMDIGGPYSPNGPGTVTFGAIPETASGAYTMVVSYISVGSSKSATITVDNGIPQVVSFPETSATDYGVIGTKDVTVSLTAGRANTIEFSGPGGTSYAPSLDRIVITG